MREYKKKFQETLKGRGTETFDYKTAKHTYNPSEEDYVQLHKQSIKKALQEVQQIQQGKIPKKSAWELIDKDIQKEFTDQYMKICELLHYCQVKRELEWVSRLTHIRDAMDKVYCETKEG